MRLLTVLQVAPRVDLDASSVRRACRRGEFPGARQVGFRRTWKIPAASVRIFNRNRRVARGAH